MTKRLLEIEPTNLFGEEAVLTMLTGREQLSRPFEFTLTIASKDTKIKPEQVIGQALAVRINRDEEEPRYVHGYINSFWAGNTVADSAGLTTWRLYRVRIAPWLWFATRASRCFVYLPEKDEKSIQEVIDEVVKRVKSYGHVDPAIECGNAKVLTKRKVEHCVQYRETDFNFLSRTLERYGVYYYFKYDSSSHTVILSDQLDYPNAPEAEVRFPAARDVRESEDVISSWEHSYEFVTGKWEHTDYDFTHPSTDLKASAQKHGAITLNNNDAYELYDYPGDYVKKDDGESEAEVRMEEEETRFNSVVGSSTCKSFSPGYCFKLTEHLNCPDEKGESYLITSVTHTATQPGPHTSDVTGANYSNSFTCIPNKMQYRPMRLTPQPLLSGVQTAEIVGPSGEEIYTDEYGRVKVQFHWDREGKKDENTSCWIRVSQLHAGKGFGGISIPRVGEEVVVSFLEGDLDRPLITGRVYHKESMPPYGLPGSKTISGVKSKTYKGKGYNEMYMDDTPGKEKVNIHAQYDMATVVEHDQTLTVKNDRTNTILGKLTETITKDTSIKVVSGTYSHDVAGNTAKYHVQGDLTETYSSNQTTKVSKSIKITAENEEIVLTAKTKITLHVGSSKLVMDQAGTIDLTGVKITVAGKDLVHCTADKVQHTGGSEAKLGVGSQNISCNNTKTEISGTAINSSAVGMHEISGALVKIN